MAEPTSDLTPLKLAVDATTTTVLWGTEGTGKTLKVLQEWPLPIVVCNLDRKLPPHLLALVGPERVEHIYVKDLREDLMALDHLTGLQVKASIEQVVTGNLDFLRGGTLFLDGGTMWRSILKFADAKIGQLIEQGKRFNPKEKEAINAYIGAFMHQVTSRGIHLAISAHAAWSWEMRTDPESGKSSLQRTHNLYPKLDDVAFEQANLSLLLFKRCECGRPIVNQDGTCTAGGQHKGRTHVVRIVTNKFDTRTEGTEWPSLTWKTLQTLCFDPEMTEALL